jgi:hypothetical protein
MVFVALIVVASEVPRVGNDPAIHYLRDRAPTTAPYHIQDRCSMLDLLHPVAIVTGMWPHWPKLGHLGLTMVGHIGIALGHIGLT